MRAENDRVEKFIELHERRLYGPKEEADTPELENLEQPAEEDTRSRREKKQHKGHLRPQTFEEPQPEPFMVAKSDDPLLKREQFANFIRKTLKQEKLSKKRYPEGKAQEKEPEAPVFDVNEGVPELQGQDNDDGFYDAQETEPRAVA